MVKVIGRGNINVFGPTNTPLDPDFDDPSVATANPYLWLYEIEVPTTPPTRYRLVQHPVAIQWGLNNVFGATPVTYLPFPIAHDTIRQDSQGSLPTTTVRLSNITLEIEQTVQNYEMMDQPIRISRIYYDIGEEFYPRLEDYNFRINGIRSTDEVLEIQCGLPNLVRNSFPARRNERLKCGHTYRGELCAYSGDLPTCSFFEEGSNGCIEHDNRARFGGKRGLPRQTSIIVG